MKLYGKLLIIIIKILKDLPSLLKNNSAKFYYLFLNFLKNRKEAVRQDTKVKLSLLKKTCELLDNKRIEYAVVGGFAFDGRRGFITRYHDDIDIFLLEDQIENTFSTLVENSFSIVKRTEYHSVAYKSGNHVDLYHWKYINDDHMRYITGLVSVQIPISFVDDKQKVELEGVQFIIPSDKFLVSIIPFMKENRHDMKRSDDINYLKSISNNINFKMEEKEVDIIETRKIENYTYYDESLVKDA